MQCDTAAALAWLAQEEGDAVRASELCHALLERWSTSEDHHYAVWGLRCSTAAACPRSGTARDLEIPFERAQILLHAGTALARTGEREHGLERLVEAHRIAQRLAAEPLTTQVAAAVTAAGGSLELLGSRAAARHSHAGLSRRELEVMRLVAQGLTNRQIAEQLVLSTRTRHARAQHPREVALPDADGGRRPSCAAGPAHRLISRGPPAGHAPPYHR
jgi:ATP/maltotriose-dependent transcriptional regulator MalT